MRISIFESSKRFKKIYETGDGRLNYFDRLPENAKYLVSMKNHGLEKGGACNE